MALPKLVLTDIDGVWTDGGMYYDMHGNEWKKFNTTDSAGVMFCRYLGIPVGIVTGEDISIVQRRAQKLKVDYLFMGAKDKVAVVSGLLEELNLSFQDVAYIGDDINDIELLGKVGISACPRNAPAYVKEHGQFVTEKAGGEGAFREFIETILIKENKLDEALELYHASKRLEQ